MKRSPFGPLNPAKRLSRRVPLRNITGSGQGSGPDRRVPIRQVSAKRAAENRQRRKMAAEMFPDGQPPCGVPWCDDGADDLHEPLTRARGGSITDPENAVPLCREHHDMITFRPESELEWAYELGLLVHSWDAPKAGDAA